MTPRCIPTAIANWIRACEIRACEIRACEIRACEIWAYYRSN